MIPCSGKALAIARRITRSASRSATVTGSNWAPGVLFVTVSGRRKCRRMATPDKSASSWAKASNRDGDGWSPGIGHFPHAPGALNALQFHQSASVAIWQTTCCRPATLFPKFVAAGRGEVAAQHEHPHIQLSAVVGPSPPWRAHLGRFLPRLGLHGHAGAALFLGYGLAPSNRARV